jgi:hypothetical protein
MLSNTKLCVAETLSVDMITPMCASGQTGLVHLYQKPGHEKSLRRSTLLRLPTTLVLAGCQFRGTASFWLSSLLREPLGCILGAGPFDVLAFAPHLHEGQGCRTSHNHEDDQSGREQERNEPPADTHVLVHPFVPAFFASNRITK